MDSKQWNNPYGYGEYGSLSETCIQNLGGFEVILVNAWHVENVPGRKTDIQDSQWFVGYIRSGLATRSFIPPRYIRELRDLTRHKSKLIPTITTEKQRVEKMLEDANIKLSLSHRTPLGPVGKGSPRS